MSAGVRVLGALRRRWKIVVGTPVATVFLAGAFVFWVTPLFSSRVSLRLVEDEGPLGGMGAAAAAGGGSGLSFLASLTGRGIPLQTELGVLSSRGLAEAVTADLGLRLDVRAPIRVPRSAVLSEVGVPLDGPEGDLDLRRRSDGSFAVTGELLTARDPFRVVGKRSYETRDLGAVAPGEAIALDGVTLRLAPEAGRFDRIRLRLLPRDRALDNVQKSLAVTRPQRDADILDVAVTWSDPALAADVANRLVGFYMTRREQIRSGEAGRTATFLTQQLDSLGKELRAAEEELRTFREARGVVAPEAQVTAEVERLGELRGRRDLLQAERSALQRLVDELAAGPAGEASAERRLVFFPTLLQSQVTAELLRLLGELENQRSALMDRRVPGARDVGLLTARIAELEGELRTVAETYLQGLDNQVAFLDQTLGEFQTELDRVPATEMEYLRRRRQVELLNEMYLFLETRLKEAEVTAAKTGVGARVLAAATVAQEPVRPKPALTLALALLVGLVLGTAGAVVAE